MHPLLAIAAEIPGEARKFQLFGGVHLTILALTFVLPWIFAHHTRHEARAHIARMLALGLAVLLALNRAFILIWALKTQSDHRWVEFLPMHLCDWAGFAIIIALIWRGQRAYELAYFWGLSGTLQALLTPDVSEDPLSPGFISFMIAHCGIIIGALYLTWGFGMRPKPGAVLQNLAWGQIYLASAGLVNWALGLNFGYLAAKPPHSSLLDYFGPWPWYLISLEFMALISYTIFYLPFWIGDRRRAATTLNTEH